jgi:hypothetical protein
MHGTDIKLYLVHACAHERQNNRTATSLRLPFQGSANIMDLNFEIFDSERFITEVEKRPTLYDLLSFVFEP